MDIPIVRTTTEEVAAGDPFVAAATRKKRARRMLAALLSSCAECGTRDADSFVSVPDGHLTFCAGDELCPECAMAHGVL
jgi:hypothetical protein